MSEDKDYVVFSDIPIPQRVKKDRRLKYPFENMGVGQCFFFSEKDRNAVLASSRVFRKRHPERRFEVRPNPGGSNSTLGIWRTK